MDVDASDSSSMMHASVDRRGSVGKHIDQVFSWLEILLNDVPPIGNAALVDIITKVLQISHHVNVSAAAVQVAMQALLSVLQSRSSNFASSRSQLMADEEAARTLATLANFSAIQTCDHLGTGGSDIDLDPAGDTSGYANEDSFDHQPCSANTSRPLTARSPSFVNATNWTFKQGSRKRPFAAANIAENDDENHDIQDFNDSSNDTEAGDGYDKPFQSCAGNFRPNEREKFQKTGLECDTVASAVEEESSAYLVSTVKSLEGIHPLIASHEELTGILDNVKGWLVDHGENIRGRGETLLELVIFFAKIFGTIGDSRVRSFIEQLRAHTTEDIENEPAENDDADDPLLRAVRTYCLQAAIGSRITIDTAKHNIRLAEFSREYNNLVIEVSRKDSPYRNKIMAGHVGKQKRAETIATDLMLRCVERTAKVKGRRKRFHGILSHARLLQMMESVFGIGVFAMIPSGRAASFRGTRQKEINAVIVVLNERLPIFKRVCQMVEEYILRPVIFEGRSGADVVGQIEAEWSKDPLGCQRLLLTATSPAT